ncbi:UNVERIFIED_CONTAM: hypothetical protein FKN15_027088 [Acipenser sinensis]
MLWQDIFQQNLGKTGAPFGALRGPQPSQASPSSSSGRPLGRRRGSKAKDSPAAPTNPSAVTPGKKRGRKSKESLAAAAAAQTAKTPGGAAELDLLEIHTKHTLKKFQGNKQPCKAKVREVGLGGDRAGSTRGGAPLVKARPRGLQGDVQSGERRVLPV